MDEVITTLAVSKINDKVAELLEAQDLQRQQLNELLQLLNDWINANEPPRN